MQPSDKRKFAELIYGVAEYYQRNLSENVVQLYWDGLKEFDFAAVSEAVSKYMKAGEKGEFMPKVSDITKLIAGTTQDAALVAWAKVDKAIRQIGTWESVVFDDPLIHKVIYDMGGWVHLGEKKEQEWPFVAKEFENRYRGYRMRQEAFAYPPRMVGISEHENGLAGRAVANPVLIGNAEMAKQVLLRGSASRELVEFKRLDVKA